MAVVVNSSLLTVMVNSEHISQPARGPGQGCDGCAGHPRRKVAAKRRMYGLHMSRDAAPLPIGGMVDRAESAIRHVSNNVTGALVMLMSETDRAVIHNLVYRVV